MITDRSVFEDDHLPRKLQHREGAVEMLLRAWSATRFGDAGDEVILSGPSGVGKTALVRFTLRRLQRKAVVEHAYVPCLGKSAAGIFRTVCRQIPGAQAPQNQPATELQAGLRAAVDRPVIVILDEADDLPDSDAVGLLGDVSQLSTVVVTHDPHEWCANLTTEHERYGTAAHIGLDRYGVDELADILAARAWAGLQRNAVDRDQLDRIADEAAGVAREGIQALRAAAELATERGHSSITDADVADSFEHARRRIRVANLASLPFHHHVLYELARQHGPIRSTDLYARYDDVADRVYRDHEKTPINRRHRRNKLKKLEQYDLLAAEGTDPHYRYHARDESITSPIDLPALTRTQ